MAVHVRKDDTVEVIAGDHRGATGKVLRMIPEKDRVVVEGVNMVYRHVRRSRRHPQGGRIQKEAAIHLSNVLVVDPKTGRGSRVHFELERDDKGKLISKKRVSAGGTVHSELTRTSEDMQGGKG